MHGVDSGDKDGRVLAVVTCLLSCTGGSGSRERGYTGFELLEIWCRVSCGARRARRGGRVREAR